MENLPALPEEMELFKGVKKNDTSSLDILSLEVHKLLILSDSDWLCAKKISTFLEADSRRIRLVLLILKAINLVEKNKTLYRCILVY